jgi:hypothetical protein
MENHSIASTQTAIASQQNGEQQPTILTTVEDQGDGSIPAGYKYPDLQTALSLNTLRGSGGSH